MQSLARSAALLLALAIPIVAIPAQKPSFGDTVLVSAQWLVKHAGERDLVVVYPSWDATPFRANHIPGARFLPLESFVEHREELHAELPSAQRLQGALELIGIGDQSRVVLYGPPTPVARLFATLESIGLRGRVAVLDGGLDAWRAAGGKVTPDESAVPRGRLTLSSIPVFADTAWLAAHRRAGVRLVDARAPRFFTGDDPGQMLRAGRIPGAINIPFTTVATDRGDYLDRAELSRLFTAAGIKPRETVVTYCHIGMQASVLYLAARALGHEARIYDGSFEEWSGTTRLPVATGR
jgi:thiosulfate/3-mercaptopyruvate sulfurtransferase